MKTIWCAIGFGAIFLSLNLIGEESWPQFRGPTGLGLSEARGLPLTWSEKENVKWKTAIHGRAWSSPVILGNQIWLTTATEDGHELFAICVDRESGEIIHDMKLFHIEEPQFAHPFNSYASPTPVIEPGRVYVTFGSPGTACIDTQTGEVLWERRDFECNHFRGAGSSPIIHEDLLIMQFDGSDHQFIVALDKETGKTVWRQERSIEFQDLDEDGNPKADGDYRKAFATPHVAQFNGEPVLLSIGSNALYAYEPLSGEELWRVEERLTHSASTRPVVGNGMVFYPTGFHPGFLIAVRPGKKGEVIDAHSEEYEGELQVVWKTRRAVSQKPSILLVDDLIFMIHDGGVSASCLDARTGEEVWRERISGNYSASPVHAGGRIYFFSDDGKTTVIEAGREFKVLAENQLEDGFMASPAIAGRAFFLRTRTHLYRIEE